jgi:plasmid stability protein
MANFSVRNLDDAVYEQLRMHAARQGISIEEAVRRLITRTVQAPARLGDLALECFGADHGASLDGFERNPHEPVTFSE